MSDLNKLPPLAVLRTKIINALCENEPETPDEVADIVLALTVGGKTLADVVETMEKTVEVMQWGGTDLERLNGIAALLKGWRGEGSPAR